MTDRSNSVTNNDAQAQLNLEVWSRGDFVKQYASRDLRPAEIVLLVRHADTFAGRVLELGCGAGRLTGYLIDLAASVHAIDLSSKMVAYCRRAYPNGDFSVEDLRDLSRFESESFDAVLAPSCVLDVLGDAERRGALGEICRVLRPKGALAMSSHNRAFIPRIRKPTDLRGARNALRAAGRLALVPRRERNRRRLLHLEHAETDYALANDNAHDFRLLHYYISRDAQERQFAEAGWRLIECLDGEGHLVSSGQDAAESSELYYVASPIAS